MKQNHERILKEEAARRQNRLEVNDAIKDQIKDRISHRIKEQGFKERAQHDRLKEEEAYQRILQVIFIELVSR